MKHLASLRYLVLVICLTVPILQAHSQQTIQVSGRITDEQTKETLIGVSVSVKGSTGGTQTDTDGKFVISVPQNAVLRISYLGYETKEVVASSSTLQITLTPATNMLEGLVVIGYGTVKRKDVTTAISTVSTKDLDQRPIVNVAQAIQGRAAGVAVMQPNGTPGAEMAIRVRGTTSYNGSNDPLYVVDGVPVDNIRFLSPNDIASMQILKDASSAAIYGSRAANGVVLIATKAGSTGNAKISLNTQLTYNVVDNPFQVLNTSQYRDLQNEIGMISLPMGLTDQTDWFNEAFNTGRIESYQLSVSDGTEKLKYFLSAGYINEKGTLDAAFFKRYNFRANVDNQIRSWLKLNANINYADYGSNGIITGTGANRGGVVLSTVNTPTYAPIWNPLNEAEYYNNFYGINNITNPLENMARSKNNIGKENRLLASGSALFTFLPKLTFKSTFALDRRNALNTTFLDPISTSWGRNQFGEGSDTRNINTVLTWDNVLTYTTSINKHNLETMAGSSWTDSKYSNSYIYGSHYRNDQIQTLNAANKISWDGTGSGGSTWAMMSYFARAMYNYDSKYLLTANLRADGSSKLHPDSRWGYFPSISAAWRISSESFLDGTKNWLDDLKIRGGWGQTGNQSGIGDYAYLQRYNISRQRWFETGLQNALPTITPANLRTKDLTWETTTQLNVGLDLSFIKNRFSVTLDYYHKKTTDMLMYITLPEGANAITSLARNEGEMTNKGFEVAISSKNLTNKSLIWDTDFNISFNKNRLDKLATQQIYSTARTSETVNEDVVRNVPGRPLGGFYGYISDGVDPETGELKYRDLNGDGKLSTSDRTYIGDPNPKFTYGMTNNFSWKNFNLSVFIQGTYGNDIFNASRMETEGMYDGKNQTTRVLNRWQVPGQITDVPKANFNMKNSTYFIEDGSYLRLKNVSLSYNFATDKLKKVGIGKLQPYLSVSNLFTLTKYTGIDPEVNQWGNSGSVQGIDWGTYPHSRSFVVGLNLEF
ncbi:TonB-dependent receptor [Pedobacter sp. UBA4863]|uniref:SusC/RagA family TonB-linked outer membrane protein n=1 Tax=Pedobacter sp. UBA4863 TaxID=1947060 RepID=UPI0025EA7218|nr:TonB-dependent receptor [Pedobacter sp. UBA4863]